MVDYNATRTGVCLRQGWEKKDAKFSTMLFVFLCVDCFLFLFFFIAEMTVGGVPETVTFAASKMTAAIVKCKEMCALHCGWSSPFKIWLQRDPFVGACEGWNSLNLSWIRQILAWIGSFSLKDHSHSINVGGLVLTLCSPCAHSFKQKYLTGQENSAFYISNTS